MADWTTGTVQQFAGFEEADDIPSHTYFSDDDSLIVATGSNNTGWYEYETEETPHAS